MKELKEVTDQIYNVGFTNGGIEMKNKILKRINRDFTLAWKKESVDLVIKILKIINKVK